MTKTADHTPVSYTSRMGEWYGHQFRFRFKFKAKTHPFFWCALLFYWQELLGLSQQASVDKKECRDIILLSVQFFAFLLLCMAYNDKG